MNRKLMVVLVVMALLMSVGWVTAQDNAVTLQFWHTYNEVGPETDMLVNTLIPMFEAEHPDIKVEAVSFPYDEFRQTLLTAGHYLVAGVRRAGRTGESERGDAGLPAICRQGVPRTAIHQHL